MTALMVIARLVLVNKFMEIFEYADTIIIEDGQIGRDEFIGGFKGIKKI